MQAIVALDAPQQRPVFMPPMPCASDLVRFETAAPSGRVRSIATTITTGTGTTGPGVRTRVHD